ncbi:MAG: SAM-dependent methyltransferase [Casimicrobium sp.]
MPASDSVNNTRAAHPLQHAKPPALPAPSPDAVAHGTAVREYLRALIEAAPADAAHQNIRSISFADFMREALYAPGLGYYTAGATKLGQDGDFVTAPELSSFFGATLSQVFRSQARAGILELGAGSGKLAADVLDACTQPPPYSILEVSADLRHRQQDKLAGRVVSWCDRLPERIDGIVLANEVLDAVPCEIVRFSHGEYQQAYVTCDPADAADAAEASFTWCWKPLAHGALFDAAVARIPEIEGYTTEINLEAEALVSTLTERLGDNAAMCFIDYGFPRRGYYVQDRVSGTLACHYKHRVHFDPLILVGLQDITAHVDFTAIAEAAVEAGAEVICYATQAQFLLAAGILTQLEAHTFSSEAARIAAFGAVQKLLSPSEMGELFKVLVVGNGDAAQLLADLARVDQSYRL